MNVSVWMQVSRLVSRLQVCCAPSAGRLQADCKQTWQVCTWLHPAAPHHTKLCTPQLSQILCLQFWREKGRRWVLCIIYLDFTERKSKRCWAEIFVVVMVGDCCWMLLARCINKMMNCTPVLFSQDWNPNVHFVNVHMHTFLLQRAQFNTAYMQLTCYRVQADAASFNFFK